MSRAAGRWGLIAAAALTVAGLLLTPMGHQAWQDSVLEAPPPSHLITDRHRRPLADVGGPAPGEHGYWALDAVPERVAAATLALEDGRFHHHPGVDLLAVARAAWQNFRCRCVHSGASTIAMQTARLQNPAPRTLGNKLREALTGLFMTTRHGRDAVLRHYLRLIPYGNGSHGIRHAARSYLDKPVEDLSWAEIALLSAVPHAPDRLNPLRPEGGQRAVARGQRILTVLHANDVIGDAELDLARRQLPALSLRPRLQRPADSLHAILEMERQLRKQPAPGGTVRSSLERRSQGLTHDRSLAWLNRYHDHGVEHVGILVADREDMAVRAMVGSAGFHHGRAGTLDFTRIRRSSGSVLKPLIYALALDRDVIGPATVMWDQEVRSPGVRNADRLFLGPLLPRQALANSRNVPAANLVQRSGLETTHAFLERAGLHDNHRPAEHYGVGMAIGTLPVTLRDVVAAFGMLANDGNHQPLRWRRDRQPDPQSAAELVGPTSARLVTRFLADPMVRLPAFSRMGSLEYPFPTAVKTGTSQDYRDAWTVAYTRDYVVGVWAGRVDGSPMYDSVGGAAVAELAREVMLGLYRLPGAPRPPSSLPRPPGHQKSLVCLRDGSTATTDCPERAAEWLPTDGASPREPQAVVGPTVPLRGAQPALVRITRPRTGSVLYRNPETPAELERIRLQVTTEPEARQVVWHVNGRPRATLRADETFRWPMQPGRHVFHAELPFRPERSPEVVVTVR